ncbi:MAG: iron dependent repressor, metal binding and dimerization domain protein [Asgard group archaeon]|nr:iron dependent repressor, metal binding and dimerization domain protein [Asgard group archaeon]
MKRRVDLENKVLDFLYSWMRPIRIGDIRTELKKKGYDIPHSSLNSIVDRLRKDELVTWEKYGPVSLTDKGETKAAHRQRHFHILVMFLKNSLDLSLEEAQEESKILSSVISCNLINKIDNKLDSPKICFCEEEISAIKECDKVATLQSD